MEDTEMKGTELEEIKSDMKWVVAEMGRISSVLNDQLAISNTLKREVRSIKQIVKINSKILGKSNSIRIKQSPPKDTHNSPVKFLHYLITGDIIKEGGFSMLYKGRNTLNGEIVAVKSITLSDNEISNMLMREIYILSQIKHPNLMEMKHVFTTQGKIHILMDYLDITLTNVINYCKVANSTDSIDVKMILRQMLCGVNHLHTKNVCHRDIKPDNILCDGLKAASIKVADFGLSRAIDVNVTLLTPQITTLSYRAPEMLLRMNYNKIVDLWAIGCIFMELVGLDHPFIPKSIQIGDNNEEDMIYCIFSKLGTPTVSSWPEAQSYFPECVKQSPIEPQVDIFSPNLDDNGNDLLSRLLCINPSNRITAEDALEHPYLRE